MMTTNRPRVCAHGILMLFAASLAFLLAACGGDTSTTSGGRVRLTVVTMQLRPTFDAYFEEVFEQFRQEHPDVEIRWLDYPFDGYETKLMTGFIGNDPPDVINIPSESLPVYARNGSLLALNDVVPADVLEGYVGSLLADGCTVDGKVYALPWYLSTFITFANKALLEQAGLPTDRAPEFVDDMPEFAARVKAATGHFAFFPLYTELGRLRMYLMEAGVELTTEDGSRAVFNTPRGVEVLEFWTRLYRDGHVPSEALTATHRRPVELFKAGRLAVMDSGPEFLRQIKADAPEVYANTVLGPRMRWRDADELHIVQMHTMAVAARSRHPELAAALAAHLTSAQAQLELSRLAPVVPSQQAALADPWFTEPDETLEAQARSIAARQAARGICYVPPPDPRRFYEALDNAMEQVATGTIDAATALQRAEDTWNELLAK